MGIWGKITSPFRGSPKVPGGSEYQSEGYFDFQTGRYPGDKGQYMGPGYDRTMRGDEMAFSALEQLYEREPGFTEEELRSIYRPAAGEIDLSVQGQLRNVNRAAAQTGAWGSGGRRASLSSAVERGGRAKAGLQFNTRAMAARVALEDRYRRIAALQGYADPRLAMMQGEHGRRLDFMQNKDRLDQTAAQSALSQYNKDFAWAEDKGKQAATYFTGIGCWVARSIYGVGDPRWLMARHYVLHNAPGIFRRFYLHHGKKIAAWLDRHTWAKRFVKPLFDWMVRQVRNAD